jgi:CheY-like chemotaxis protein
MPTPRRCVLIAENDPGVSSVFAEVLARRGLEVETVADGKSALERLRAGGVDVLVCDLDMPTMSGDDLLRQIETWDRTPDVVVVSGFIDDALCAELGGHPSVREILRKPFDVLKFADFVAGLVDAEPDGRVSAVD